MRPTPDAYGDPGQPQAQIHRRHRRLGGSVYPARHSQLYSLRQRPGICRHALRKWITDIGAQTAYIEPGSPWENGYCESFNSKLRDELLNGEIFYSLQEAKVVIETWRIHYNTQRPHSSLGYKPPAPAAVLGLAAQPGPASPAIAQVALKPTMH